MNPYFVDNHERGFGSYLLLENTLHQSVQSAAKIGYRAFDTAQMYDNEADMGSALKATGIPRGELLITTKVHPDNFSEEAFMPSVEASLRALQTDYVDVLLLHWPPIGGNIAPSLQLLEEAAKKGLTRYIGVSNYTCSMMHQAKQLISTPLIINQVEFHPLLNQDKLLACATETGIPLSSYCSVARGEIFSHPELTTIAANYNKSVAQVTLRWILQKGVAINTMSSKEQNIRNNFDVMGFTLSHVDMAIIDRLTTTQYRIVSKDLVPWAPEWD